MTARATYSFSLVGEKRARIVSERTKQHYEVGFLAADFFQYNFREIFESGCYDIALDAEAPFIVDAGANIGLSTLFFHDRWPRASIYAIEPDEIAFSVLQANLATNALTSATAINGALWDKSETTQFNVDRSRPGRLRHSCFAARLSGTAVPVKAAPLFEWVDLETIDLLKLDVEGAETRVIQQLVGADHLRRIRHLAIEFHHQIGIGESLGAFLTALEHAGFSYHLKASGVGTDVATSQDVLVYASRSTVAR